MIQVPNDVAGEANAALRGDPSSRPGSQRGLEAHATAALVGNKRRPLLRHTLWKCRFKSGLSGFGEAVVAGSRRQELPAKTMRGETPVEVAVIEDRRAADDYAAAE